MHGVARQLAMLKNSAAKKPCGFVEVYELRLAQRGEMRAGSTTGLVNPSGVAQASNTHSPRTLKAPNSLRT